MLSGCLATLANYGPKVLPTYSHLFVKRILYQLSTHFFACFNSHMLSVKLRFNYTINILAFLPSADVATRSNTDAE